jgi:hypothetical protein
MRASIDNKSFQNLDDYLLRNSRDSGIKPKQLTAINKNHDEEVIPTLAAGGKQNPFDEYGIDDTAGIPKIPEKLTKDEDIRFAEPLMQVFNEQLILMLFSTDWHTRELGLKNIKE